MFVVSQYPKEKVQIPKEAFKVTYHHPQVVYPSLGLCCVHTEPLVLCFQSSDPLPMIFLTLKTFLFLWYQENSNP